MQGPLSGIRILELTTTVAGPTVGMILGGQGADIIKIEPPGIGDLGRFMGDMRGGMSSMFATLNRNKRSLVLDLKQTSEMAVFRELAKTADVVLENYRPGVVEKLGIDYATLSDDNPRLVYCSISGYGSSGPYRHRRVYDPLIQATVGASAEQGGERAQNIRSVVFDKVCGYTAAQSITAALLQRERTGRGGHLDISMLGAALYFQWPDVMWSHTYQGEGVVSGGPLADWFNVFSAADGDIAIVLMVSDGLFQLCCEALGLELHLDERFASFASRLANRPELQRLLDTALSSWTVAELVETLDRLEVPVAPVNTLDAVFDDPQVVEQGMILDAEHPTSGAMKLARNPCSFNDSEATAGQPAPVLGEHSEEILTDLGVDRDEIQRMQSREARNRAALADFHLHNAR
ncbi:MAG: CoA transferase [Pseudomonadota bacterium]